MSVNVPSAWQLRAARAALGWSLGDLQERCGISRNSLSLYERGKGNPAMATLLGIKHAYQEAGIVFRSNVDHDYVGRRRIEP